jgi:16S rRNA processing protein RimM
VVGAPFGIAGRVKIQSLSGEIDHILALKTVVLRQEGREKSYVVEESTPTPLTMKFAGIESPEAAKTLKGAEILVDRSQAAPLDEGEFYIEDLLGLKVFLRKAPETSGSPGNESPVGEITNIIEGGGAFLVEVALPTGEKKLIPFRNEFFGDPEQGRIELIQGWILEEP